MMKHPSRAHPRATRSTASPSAARPAPRGPGSRPEHDLVHRLRSSAPRSRSPSSSSSDWTTAAEQPPSPRRLPGSLGPQPNFLTCPIASRHHHRHALRRRYMIIRKLGSGGIATSASPRQKLGAASPIRSSTTSTPATTSSSSASAARRRTPPASRTRASSRSTTARGGRNVLLAIEYVEGRTLKELLVAAPLPLGSRSIPRQILSALRFAPRNGIRPPRRQPHNVIVDSSGTSR